MKIIIQLETPEDWERLSPLLPKGKYIVAEGRIASANSRFFGDVTELRAGAGPILILGIEMYRPVIFEDVKDAIAVKELPNSKTGEKP